MNAKRIVAWVALVLVATSTLWILFSSYELAGLVLSDAQLIVAHEGAEIALKDDGLWVLQGEAGMLNGGMLPIQAVPF